MAQAALALGSGAGLSGVAGNGTGAAGNGIGVAGNGIGEAGNGTGGRGAGALLALAVGMLALPSAVLAFNVRFDTHTPGDVEPEGVAPLDSDSPGLRLARGMRLESLSHSQAFPFTPAKNPNRPDRLITVAVRRDPQTLQVLAPRAPADGTAPNVRLAQSAFSLGAARGYRNFAQSIAAAAPTRRPDAPDAARFNLPPGGTQGDSRFTARGGVIDEKQLAGRTTHGLGAGAGEQADLGGSYRVTRNIDVTAGIRYSPDRERLRPQTDGRQDGQAVYVGTQFKF